jgi:hypothetical protein
MRDGGLAIAPLSAVVGPNDETLPSLLIVDTSVACRWREPNASLAADLPSYSSTPCFADDGLLNAQRCNTSKKGTKIVVVHVVSVHVIVEFVDAIVLLFSTQRSIFENERNINYLAHMPMSQKKSHYYLEIRSRFHRRDLHREV